MWTLLGLPDQAVVRTITVLVIACPHALGLAIPLVVSIATERAARGGVLVKDRLALESMRTVDTVLFDKTGTLTKGQPTSDRPSRPAGHSEDEVLALAASAEADSEHPLARAIVAAAEHRQAARRPPATDFTLLPGGRGLGHRRRAPRPGRRPEPAAASKARPSWPVAEQWRGRGRDHPARAGRRAGGRRAEAGRRDPGASPAPPCRRCTPAACRW